MYRKELPGAPGKWKGRKGWWQTLTVYSQKWEPEQTALSGFGSLSSCLHHWAALVSSAQYFPVDSSAEAAPDVSEPLPSAWIHSAP